MSPEQQRIAIAEACGWTFDKSRPSEKVVSWLKRWLSPRKSDTNYYFCPDYLNDLNAMREALKTLTCEQLQKFCLELDRVSTAKMKVWDRCLADAGCYAEAFLRTIGKWEGGAK